MHVFCSDIRIKFGDAKKLPKSDVLQVLLGDLDSITVANSEKVDSLTRRWTLDSEMYVTPLPHVNLYSYVATGYCFPVTR